MSQQIQRVLDGQAQYALVNCSAQELLEYLPENSVHQMNVDGPYGIDQLSDDWNHSEISKSRAKAGAVGGMPVGMKFTREQFTRSHDFWAPLWKQAFSALVPGGTAFSFAQQRLVGPMQYAMQEAGFENRDIFLWEYVGQGKAFSHAHFLKKMNLSEREKEKLRKQFETWKSPQLAPRAEPAVVGMKPTEGTTVENFIKYGVGFYDISAQRQVFGEDAGNSSNVVFARKPSKAERGEGNDHPTVKPVSIIEYLIRLTTQPGQLVVDFCMGSGTAAVAARRAGRRFIGCDVDAGYVEIARQRTRRV